MLRAAWCNNTVNLLLAKRFVVQYQGKHAEHHTKVSCNEFDTLVLSWGVAVQRSDYMINDQIYVRIEDAPREKINAYGVVHPAAM